MNLTRIIACALLFVLAALHGRRTARAVQPHAPVMGTPITALLHTRGGR